MLKTEFFCHKNALKFNNSASVRIISKKSLPNGDESKINPYHCSKNTRKYNKKNMKSLRLLFLLPLFTLPSMARAGVEFSIQRGESIDISCNKNEQQVVQTAIDLLRHDFREVFSSEIKVVEKKGEIVVGTIGISKEIEKSGADLTPIKGKSQAYILEVVKDGRLIVAGSDARGTAYGLMELSRLIGVSPWEWWADATPEKKESFSLPLGYHISHAPTVEYRGIFINDEDWGFLPWSTKTYEPTTTKGRIGPKTHERVFELLLRLRANLFWPAMHSCSLPFYYTEGNKEMAMKYGIYIGTSHCEPMMRNTNGEWARDGVGEYDYVHNRDNVLNFWEERTKDVAHLDNIYTLGIRGVHDGAMQGAKTIDEQLTALTDIIRDQRLLLSKYVNPKVEDVPQVFIPYKEVLDVYDAGLEVPDDVTLIWCDDNYGYVRHFPTAEEQTRRGGNGIYYHISYWGRPHDYLWLATTSPFLIFQQMDLAWQHGIQKLWVVNVGDIKPAEYLTELFLDMAWDIHGVEQEGVSAHLEHFLEREFGSIAAEKLLPVMKEYYRLAYIRKPEFMGNTRTEEKDPKYKVVTDMPWSAEQMQERIADYRQLSSEVEDVKRMIAHSKKDAYFQLVEYPVKAAAKMNEKLLFASLARHGKADWAESDAAYDSIVALTNKYNTGKWLNIIDYHPRRLPVFAKMEHTNIDGELPSQPSPAYLWNGADYARGKAEAIEGLGVEGKAVAINKGDSITFDFASLPKEVVDVELRLLPSHPIDGKHLRIGVAIDNGKPQIVDYATQGRNEEWKENVLRNQAIRRLNLPLSPSDAHTITITALDDGVVLDECVLYD